MLKSVLIYVLNIGKELFNVFIYFLLIERLIIIKIYIREKLFRCKLNYIIFYIFLFIIRLIIEILVEIDVKSLMFCGN